MPGRVNRGGQPSEISSRAQHTNMASINDETSTAEALSASGPQGYMGSRGFDRPMRPDPTATEESTLTEAQSEIVNGILSSYDVENLSEEDITAIQSAIQSAIELGELEPGRALAEAVREYGFDPQELFPREGGHAHHRKSPDTADEAATETTVSEIDSYLSGDENVDDSEEFNIEVNFLGEWSSALTEAVTNAADYLSDLIQNDTALDSSADLTIDIALLDIDGENGVLGSSTVTDTWGDSYTPSESLIEFDAADASSYLEQGLWDDIVLHEMIHSLGFGTVWQNEGSVEVTTDENGETVAEYTGESASALEPTAADTPVVETDGGTGTAYGHWDEETHDNELMTGTIDESNYISEMTYGALEDLGYEIDYTIDVSNYLGIDSEASLTAATSVVAEEVNSSVSVESGEMLMVADVLDLGVDNLVLPEEEPTAMPSRPGRGFNADNTLASEWGGASFDREMLMGQPQHLFFDHS